MRLEIQIPHSVSKNPSREIQTNNQSIEEVEFPIDLIRVKNETKRSDEFANVYTYTYIYINIFVVCTDLRDNSNRLQVLRFTGKELYL